MTRRTIRLAFVALLTIQTAYLGVVYAENTVSDDLGTYREQAELPYDERTEIVADRPNVTVVTGQQSPTVRSKALYAFAPDGRLLYYSQGDGLGDVDPSPEGRMTVMHPLHTKHSGNECGSAASCSRQRIVRTNLSTGEQEVVFRFMTAKQRATNWHDVDRVPGTNSYLIASIAHDRVWRYNASTGVTEWGWHAQSEYTLESGGTWPYDWTHLNDVDRLPDGRVMLSLRNQDQVVFIHPEKGLQEDWTLGEDDNHEILYEQHNPDYIPASEGGPAVLVADSENNRIVEYQRVNGEWKQSWVWSDGRLDWPRDADRLPNGHTLIADSHGNRVLEVSEDGDVVWEATAPNVYNVERLGTGDGSTGGPSAVRAGLESRGGGGDLGGYSAEYAPSWVDKQWNKAEFVLPDWMTFSAFLIAVEMLGVLFVWGCVEAYWRGLRVRSPLARIRPERVDESAD